MADMAYQEAKKRVSEQAQAVPVSLMTDGQVQQSIDMLRKEQLRRQVAVDPSAKAEYGEAGMGNSRLGGLNQTACDYPTPRGARSILTAILEGEERKCLEKIGELQEMRKRVEGMYLSDVEAVLELSQRFHSFDKR